MLKTVYSNCLQRIIYESSNKSLHCNRVDLFAERGTMTKLEKNLATERVIVDWAITNNSMR